jgi:membrane dipeptidase
MGLTPETLEVTGTHTVTPVPGIPSTLPPEPSAKQTATPTQTLPPPLPFPPLVIDGHEDIAWMALEFGRDPRLSALETRQREAGSGLPVVIGERTTGLPDWLVGRVGLVFSTLFVMPQAYAYPGYNRMTYTSPQQAETRAWEQLTFYQQVADEEPFLQLVTDQTSLEAVTKTWLQSGEEPVVGWVLLMEGAEAILTPADLPRWYEAGLRILGPAWKATRYAGGTGAPGPLTRLGYKLLEEMAALNMILDLSHLSEQAYQQAVEVYPGQMIASHSNPRPFNPGDRGLSAPMITQLAQRDGVMGIMPYNRYLQPGWQAGQPRLPLDTVVDAIDYVVQVTGSARYVALGSDFDGGFGVESLPEGMDTVADLRLIAQGLQERGYSVEEVGLILYSNWLRVLKNSLP